MEDIKDYKVGEGDQNGENTVTETMKDNAPTIDDQNPKFESEKDVPEEVAIEFLMSPENKRIHAASPELLRRKDLIPCDKNGKRIYDHRIF